MSDTQRETGPVFRYGFEVAQSPKHRQPGFEDQLPLLQTELALRKKLMIAGLVILSAFMAGMLAGIIAGFFI